MCGLKKTKGPYFWFLTYKHTRMHTSIFYPLNFGALLRRLRPFLSSHWVAFGRPSYVWAVLLGVPQHWRVPPASEGHPPKAFTTFWGRGYCLAPEAHLKREMPTGPKVFLALPDACGLRPCDRTYLKNGLVPHSCVGGTYDKYIDTLTQ